MVPAGLCHFLARLLRVLSIHAWRNSGLERLRATCLSVASLGYFVPVAHIYAWKMCMGLGVCSITSKEHTQSKDCLEYRCNVIAFMDGKSEAVLSSAK
jgi:hypothetical protein